MVKNYEITLTMQAKASVMLILAFWGCGFEPHQNQHFFHFLWWFLIHFAFYHNTKVPRLILDHIWISVQVH